MKKLYLAFALVVAISFSWAQSFTLYSPDKHLRVDVEISKKEVHYSVSDAQGVVIAPSSVSMRLADGRVLGNNPKYLRKEHTATMGLTVEAPFYRKSKIPADYNELALTMKGDYKVVLRAYNQGVAYRFETAFRDSITVVDEHADFHFAEDYPAYVPYANVNVKKGESYERQFTTSCENQYTHLATLSSMDPDRIAFLPVMVELPQGRKVVITEADLLDYPGMYVQGGDAAVLHTCQAPLPKTWEQGGHNNLQYIVKERENYIAKTKGTRAFPWRVMAISQSDKELVDNDMVYLLASPSKLEDISWIKPGKVAWDWWNAWNIWDVDFEAGINTATYKYYIDFAAQYGVEYVILDEGWAVNKKADLFQVVPEIDLPEIVNYAKNKGVGIVLWVGYAAIDKDMEHVCEHYAKMGVKGFKVDFMDRDDQIAVNFYERMAATAAKYHLFVDFHGAYKPTGLQRTYPNVLNFEGVFGLEQMKWADAKTDQVTYDVTIPYIRMLAGPMDYTQGAMRNATKWCYAPCWNDPMSQGTRCHQLAEYVVFDAPFSMLCDAPTAYMREAECMAFIADVPTVWDETRILDGEVAKYVVSAKRKGDVWYVGLLNNWDARDITLDLSSLQLKGDKATLFVDGANAHRKGCDYKKKEVGLPTDKQLEIHLAPGGGAVVVAQ